eukprot:m.432070 g.432070  ORF g.432070 m.432070 type:complete len:335 (+) comp17385_c0_seq1:3888-4892(+)
MGHGFFEPRLRYFRQALLFCELFRFSPLLGCFSCCAVCFFLPCSLFFQLGGTAAAKHTPVVLLKDDRSVLFLFFGHAPAIELPLIHSFRCVLCVLDCRALLCLCSDAEANNCLSSYLSPGGVAMGVAGGFRRGHGDFSISSGFSPTRGDGCQVLSKNGHINRLRVISDSVPLSMCLHIDVNVSGVDLPQRVDEATPAVIIDFAHCRVACAPNFCKKRLHVTKGGGGIGAIDSEDKRRCGRVAIAAKNCRRHRLGGFFDRIDHDNVSLGAKDQRQSEPECLEFPSGCRRNRLRPGAAFYPHAQWILPNAPLLVPRVCQPTVTRQFGRCAEAANTQ